MLYYEVKSSFLKEKLDFGYFQKIYGSYCLISSALFLVVKSSFALGSVSSSCLESYFPNPRLVPVTKIVNASNLTFMFCRNYINTNPFINLRNHKQYIKRQQQVSIPKIIRQLIRAIIIQGIKLFKMATQNTSKNYYELSGELQKLSASVFVGYQTKFFSFLQNGTKIAYRNLKQTQFKQQNTFFIKEVVVCEAEEDFSFTLETPQRTYTLKAKDEQMKVKWMRAITRIRKQIIRKKFKINIKSIQKAEKTKLIPSSTENTIPVVSLQFLNQTQRSITSNYLTHTERSLRMSSIPLANPEKDAQLKKDCTELLKQIPQQFLKYNVYVNSLKSKVQSLFTANYSSNTYILISSKSLYPFQQINQENLTNMMLPQWAEVNKMYKLSTNKNSSPKLFLQISKIIDIEDHKQEKNCLKVRTDENVHSFFCQTVQEKQRLKSIVSTAITNYKEVLVNGKLSRRNFDKIVKLYNSQYDQFLESIKQLVAKFIPNNHHYEPQVVIRFIDVVIPFIQQFIQIIGNKKQQCNQIILQVLKEFHEEIKIHIKLTWDTSYAAMKGEDILKFLNALAAYFTVIKDYISDIEFLTGMKQLSKIYVRESWKNFQDIILAIVEQQKKSNFFVDEDNEYAETNSIIDLFKFIYEVYDLAAPCWDHRLHLYNVQKLMNRAISVFIDELKALVDETVLSNKQLMGIANNYFRFCLTIDEFYKEKFSILQEKTKEPYDKLKLQYKQLSNIILDKLVFDVRLNIKKHFQKSSFFALNISKLYELLKQKVQLIEIEQLQQIFIKRFYQKVFGTVRECVLLVLEKEITSKKKNNVPKILQKVDEISFDLVDISRLLYEGKSKIDKDLNQINILLQCENHNEILKLIKGSAEDIRKTYLNIVNLREDYYVGGSLHRMLNDESIERNSLAVYHQQRTSVKPSKLTPALDNEMRASFSNYYMTYDFDAYSSADKSQKDSYEQPLKLISQGFLMKCKTNKKVWEKQYFRLKNGILFFYQNGKSQKCQNSVPVEEMISVSISMEDNTGFTILYRSLNRQKQLFFKCESMELRERWLESISLELKRVKNEQKVKKQKLKLKQKKKNYLIIDYEQLMNGKSYFSYTAVSV